MMFSFKRDRSRRLTFWRRSLAWLCTVLLVGVILLMQCCLHLSFFRTSPPRVEGYNDVLLPRDEGGRRRRHHHNEYAAICVLVKHEEQYVEEWLDYHLGLGFGHIYLYDDDPSNPMAKWNGYHLPNSLNPSAAVTVIPTSVEDWHIRTAAPYNTIVGEKQVLLYHICADMLGQLHHPPRWVMISDVDEFLVFKNNMYRDVNTFLKEQVPEGALRLPWLNFGTSGRTKNNSDREPVTKRFLYSMIEDKVESKYIAVLDHVQTFDVHFPLLKPGYHVNVQARFTEPSPQTFLWGANYSMVALHHYRYKSRQEYWQRRCVLATKVPYWYNCSKHARLPTGSVYDVDAWETLRRNVPKYQKMYPDPVPPPPDPKVLIVVSTSRNHLFRVRTILETWGNILPPHVHLHFFVGEVSSQEDEEIDVDAQLAAHVGMYRSNQRFRVMKGITDQEYPPVYRHNRMLQEAAATLQQMPTIDFVFKVDDDTYVNVQELLKFLKYKDPSKHHFWGEPAWGSPDDRSGIARAGLKKPYCNGGTGYIFSRTTLLAIAPKMQTCVEQADASPYRKYIFWDDVILGLCMQQEIGKGCGNDDVSYNALPLWKLPFRPLVFDANREDRPETMLNSVSVHPLKKPEQMESLHYFISNSSRSGTVEDEIDEMMSIAFQKYFPSPQESTFDRLWNKKCLKKQKRRTVIASKACRTCLYKQHGSSCQQCATACSCFCETICAGEAPHQERKVKEHVVKPHIPPANMADRFIPRIVHQTWFEPVVPDRYPEKYEQMQSFNKSNWEYRFYTDQDARDFIKTHFSEEVVEAFDAVIPGAFKADLFRYCVLIIHGGLYADTDMLLESNLDEAVPGDVGFLVPLDEPGLESDQRSCLWNGFMAAAPGHPVLARVIEMAVKQIRNRATSVDLEIDLCQSPDHWVVHTWSTIFLTGPCLLGSAMNQLLGHRPQQSFAAGEVVIPHGSEMSHFRSTLRKLKEAPKIVLLHYDPEWKALGAQRYMLLEKNLSVAATNFGGWKKDADRLHYTETPNAWGPGIWGLSGVYRDSERVNEDIRITIDFD